MKKIFLLVFSIIVLVATNTSAQKILTFDFSTLTVGDEVTANSNYNDPNFSSSIISRGIGVETGATTRRRALSVFFSIHHVMHSAP